MTVIGITGPTGAGKSLLCRLLEKKNIPCIDADGVYHSLLVPPSECLEALRAAFGEEIFNADGSLDRARLGQTVFNFPEKLELLNSTVLPRVLDAIRDIISELESKGFDTVAVDAPTLIESGFHKECDTVVSVLAPAELRLARIIERDGITQERAELRIKAQKSDDFYRENSDHILINDGNTKKFEKDIISLLTKLNIN